MVVGLSQDLLSAAFAAQSAVAAARSGNARALAPSGAETGSAAAGGNEVLPPWDPRGEIAALADLRRSVLASGTFFEPDFGAFADLETGDQEKSLFTLYRGLRRLQSLAEAAADTRNPPVNQSLLERRFGEGLAQLDGFFETLELDGVTVLKGEDLSKAESTLTIKRGGTEYVGAVVQSGPFDAEVAAFQGDVPFAINIRKNGIDTRIDINLNALGPAPRTLDAVAGLINSRLEAEGFVTLIERVKIGPEDENGIIQGEDFGFKVKGVQTEQVRFEAGANAQPAVFVAGVSGDGEDAAGQLSKIVDLAGGGTTAFSRRLEADPAVGEAEGPDGETRATETANPLTVRATAKGPDGALFVLSETEAGIDGQTLRGERDLALTRFDSNGQPVWTRILGASGEISAASLAVDANGDVIAAGSVKGGLNGTTDIGGTDSLVVKFSADGVEQFTRRFGSTSDDRINAVTVGADGTIFAVGETSGPFAGAGGGQGKDAFVRAISASGQTLFTRSLAGGAGDQSAEAAAVAADGGLVVASREAGRAVIRKFAPGDDGTGAPVSTLDLGDLDGGRIGGLAVDETGAIFFAGSAGAGFAPTAPITANAGGRDAVLVKIEDGASLSAAFTTFLGSDSSDSAASIATEGGQVFLAGTTAGDLPGETLQGTRDSFAAGINAATGAVDFITTISGRRGQSQAAGLVVDPQGDNALSKLGLPTGALVFSDSRAVTDRSAVRDEDSFSISVNGGRKRKITVEAGDTFRSLTFKLNAALVLDGTAQVRRTSAGERLVIEPADGSRIELFAGPEGRDALSGLGLPEGAVTGDALEDDAATSADAPRLFALELPSTLSIADPDAARAASDALGSALAKVQRAYRELTLDPALRAALEGPTAGRRDGQAPAFLTAQIANLEAGLARLQAAPSAGQAAGLFL